MTCRLVAGACSTHAGSVHAASESSSTNAPPSIHSNVARPRPGDPVGRIGSNSQVPMRTPSGERPSFTAPIPGSAALRGEGGVLREDRVDLADGLGQALLLAHRQELLHRL